MPNVPPIPICAGHPDWIGLYHASWRIAAKNVEHPSAPGWKPQMCCMPDAGIIWLWDSCFMPFFARYGNGAVPVMNNLDNLYRLQREDGFIGMAYEVESETLAYGERVNPPLLAWTELNYWTFSGDDARLQAVLPRLVRFFDWIKANRRRKTGLYWFEDSGSTGMDNSPRSGYFAEHLNGSDICHVDLAGQQALAAECIAAMADHLGHSDLARRFRDEHAEIVTVLNRFHWNARSGFYYDVFSRDTPTDRHNFLNHKTIAAFWPMMAGCCSEEQIEALLKHLLNPDEFWTKHPVASLSKDDPNFDPAGAYWLGGVWAPINYMLVKALKRLGRPEIARRLAIAHLDAMAEVYRSADYSGIWEAYAPDSFLPATKKPTIDIDGKSPFVLSSDTVVKADFVGWSGLGPVAMLIEDIFGIEFDAPRQRILWNVETFGEHGIENLEFSGGVVSLRSSGFSDCRQNLSVTVSTNKPVTLVLSLRGEAAHETLLEPGTHTFELTY
jgi:glycogen debranching enzyme